MNQQHTWPIENKLNEDLTTVLLFNVYYLAAQLRGIKDGRADEVKAHTDELFRRRESLSAFKSSPAMVAADLRCRMKSGMENAIGEYTTHVWNRLAPKYAYCLVPIIAGIKELDRLPYTAAIHGERPEDTLDFFYGAGSLDRSYPDKY